MALNLSKLNFFSRLDARARVFVLLGGVIGVIFLIYLGTHYFSNGNNALGPSRVANAPKGLQSVPGSSLTAEYSKALQLANTQAAQQAQMSGGSAVPTLMNYSSQSAPASSGNCNIICTDQSTNVKYNLDDWVRQGKVAPDVSTALQVLANKNVSVGDYAAQLDQLVKEGKLTPEQARELLEQYKKQYANNLLADSAKTMDGLIKSGKLPLDVANELLALQKGNVSQADYAAKLQELVRQGKISPETAQQLLTQYSQQHAKEVVNQSIAILHQMARAGQIMPEIEKALVDLETKMVPLETYTAALQRYVSAGKLIPVVASRILDEYKSQKASIGISGSINQMLQKAETAAADSINDLVRAKKISPEVAQQLLEAMQKNGSVEDYAAAVNQLVQQGKLSPEAARIAIEKYRAVKGLHDAAQKLETLQANNASAAAYADELKRQVQAGIITPEQAAQLLQEYQASTTRAPIEVGGGGPTTDAFARLQERVSQQGVPATQPVPTSAEFSAAQIQATQQTAQDQQNHIESLMNAMSGQASQLVNAWQPVIMTHKEGTPPTAKSGANGAAGSSTTSTSTSTSTTASSATTGALIKAGTIIFAVLDTTANSDYPDSPVMATVVDGPYKDAKLLGKLVTTKGVSGQMDRISLNFTLMNEDAWPNSKSVTAYGIDPDTARTVMASRVDYHYLQRFGAMMATSFLQGYASAITQAGTSTTGIFGTSTTHPALSPSQKIATALGQMGQTVGAATANYINIPPTVKVDAGVGLGILFMSDVS
jgi:type IV secretory pathway VirB10-like protein